MSSSILNWNPILTAWLKKRPNVMLEVLMPAFEGSFCGTSLKTKTYRLSYN